MGVGSEEKGRAVVKLCEYTLRCIVKEVCCEGTMCVCYCAVESGQHFDAMGGNDYEFARAAFRGISCHKERKKRDVCGLWRH